MKLQLGFSECLCCCPSLTIYFLPGTIEDLEPPVYSSQPHESYRLEIGAIGKDVVWL